MGEREPSEQTFGRNELGRTLREVFRGSGYGCLAVETDIGVVHICHAADTDIELFAGAPIRYQWQLVKMPTAPLIRLQIDILDRPSNPYRFECFFNPADEAQANMLAQLANQSELYLAFYGDDLTHRFTKTVAHDNRQWQRLDELAFAAMEYLEQITPAERDFDRAKADFMGAAK